MFVFLLLCGAVSRDERAREGAARGRRAPDAGSPACAERLHRFPGARRATERVAVSMLDARRSRAGEAGRIDPGGRADRRGREPRSTSRCSRARAGRVAKRAGDRLTGGAVNVDEPARHAGRARRAGHACSRASCACSTGRRATSRALAQLADRVAQGFVAALLVVAAGAAVAWCADRSGARAVGHGVGAGRELPLRALARDAGGADGGDRRADAARRAGRRAGMRSKRSRGDPRRLRQDRHADRAAALELAGVETFGALTARRCPARWRAALERGSEHPIAAALRRGAERAAAADALRQATSGICRARGVEGTGRRQDAAARHARLRGGAARARCRRASSPASGSTLVACSRRRSGLARVVSSSTTRCAPRRRERSSRRWSASGRRWRSCRATAASAAATGRGERGHRRGDGGGDAGAEARLRESAAGARCGRARWSATA